jgi:glutaredoxin
MTEPAIDAVDFYWRRGCGVCMMLNRSLTKAGVAIRRHDIWSDPAAAEVVRTWAGGSETVPTVVVGDLGLVNPSSDQVIAVLSEKAPHLVPAGWEPRRPGAIRSVARRLLGG